METALLIDGNSVMYRAYFATAIFNTMTNSKGLNTNCVYAFYNMMYKLDFAQYDYVMIAFDKGKMTKRHELLPSYKDGRKATPMELVEQIPYVKSLSTALGALVLEKELVEADDIVGTIAKKLNEKNVFVNVLTSDKDLLQLVNDKTIVKLTKKGVTNLEEYNVNNFKELTELAPTQITDLKGLMGDSSDNLKGIPGIGEKTAIKLLHTYHSLEGIVENINELKGKQKEKFENHYQEGLLCKQVATIDVDSDIEFKYDDLRYNGVMENKLVELFEELEFYSVINRYNVSESDVELETIIVDDEAIINEILKEKETCFHIEYLGENYHTAKILAIAISCGDKLYYFDFDTYINSKLMKDYFEKSNKICFDLKSSIVILNKYGVTLNNIIFDALLASYVINPDTKDKLVSVALKYSVDCPSDTSIYTKNFDFNIEELSSHVLKKLNALAKLYPILSDKIKEDQDLFNLELDLSYCLASMEIDGVKVNLDELASNKSKYSSLIKELEKEIHILAGMKFNINSPKQLGEILFDHLEIPYYKKTKTGSYATSVDILNKIKNYEIVEKVLLYRKYSKLLSTYIEGIEKTLINDKIHTIYKQALTVTGRLSSIEPNMQNLPIRSAEGKEIRKMFVSNNGVLLGLDYSQIELRVLASLSMDDVMLEAFNNDKDIHSITAAKINNISLDDVTPEHRRIAKAVNFGIIYGQTPFGLSEELSISFQDAKNFINEYFKTYPSIKNYLDSLVEFTKETSYAKTIYNRRRYINDINSSNKMTREFAMRTSMNAPIQGSAADILKLAMVKLYKELSSKNFKSKIVLQIHDELILDVFEDELEQVTNLAVKSMEKAYDLAVKLVVDYNKGKNLAELK